MLFSVLAMAREAVIDIAPYGDWYGAHAMDGSGSLSEENAERRICRCASSSSGSEVEAAAPKSKAFREILAELPVVDTSVECIWRREDSGGTTGLEFEALQLKVAVK